MAPIVAWDCCRCGNRMSKGSGGGPRWCPRCGHTVYRPVFQRYLDREALARPAKPGTKGDDR